MMHHERISYINITYTIKILKDTRNINQRLCYSLVHNVCPSGRFVAAIPRFMLQTFISYTMYDHKAFKKSNVDN